MMDLLAWLENTTVATWIREGQSTIWAYPTVLTLHTFGLMVLVGASVTLDLRLLGVATSIPLAPMRTLFRLMWAGFWINTVTGLLLFAANATTRATSPLFLTKLLLVALGVVTMVLIERSVYGTGAPTTTAGRSGRLLAAASIVIWTAAITAGRLLAYV
jgi:hypothetical protein